VPALVAALLGIAPPALADEAEREARAMFERGTNALRSGRVAEARDLFRRSLATLPTAPTAFNLAVALRGTGETSESVSLFGELLEGRFGDLSTERRVEVLRLRRETRAELALLEVANAGAEPITVSLVRPDQRPVAASAARLEIAGRRRAKVRVDAGAYDLRAESPGHLAATHHLELERGGRAVWSPVLVAEGAASSGTRPAPARSPPSPAATPFYGRPWFWIATGAAIVAAGVVTWVALEDRTGDPVSDEVFGVVEALMFRP